MIDKPFFSIIGSCVTRDSLEFIQGRKVTYYLARSSLCSIFSNQPTMNELELLEIYKDAHDFYKDCIKHDVFKTGLVQLGSFNSPIIIDLIEERVPLGILPSGAVVTSSQPARMFSNLDSLLLTKVEAFSDEHLMIFESSMKSCSIFFTNRQVFIHKALYVDSMQKFNENIVLNKMYDMLLNAIPHAFLIEAEDGSRVENENHKWGLAPYHYIDSYYKSFVDILSEHVSSVKLNNSMSMNK